MREQERERVREQAMAEFKAADDESKEAKGDAKLASAGLEWLIADSEMEAALAGAEMCAVSRDGVTFLQ